MGTFSNLRNEAGSVFCFECDFDSCEVFAFDGEIPEQQKMIRNVDVLILNESGGARLYLYARDLPEAKIRAEKKILFYRNEAA